MSHLQPKFSDVSTVTPSVEAKPKKKSKRAAPLSLRLSDEERETLVQAAGGASLNSYIKSKVFDGEMKPRRMRGQAPVKDHAALARALGLLGNLRLANNLNQLAKAANMGALPLSPEVEQELMATCAAVIAIRAELMKALGYSSDASS
ncbi:plasmid mobilization relaxosome protein MobC [Microbulbifer sp. S227A]|uniref:plasmid mobilization relaxosome protein MobC n=1 Tax=Microbulbifer sp. S227A TaxID=3415131 RepID=UPI003C7A61A5